MVADFNGANATKFHAEFARTFENLFHSKRFLTAIDHCSVIYRSNSLCTWIPKNGCSSVRYSIARANGFLDDSHDIDWIHDNNQIFRPSLRDCFDATYSFVFLRCPLERLVSAFLDKLVGSAQAPAFQSRFQAILGVDEITKFFSFSDFVNVVVQANLEDEHWQPQSQFLLLNNYSDYFNLSEFDRASDLLRKKIGFNLRDTRAHLKHDTSHFCQADFHKAYDLSIAELQDLRSRGMIPNKRSFLNELIVSTIAQHWKSDFEIYGQHFGPGTLWPEFGIAP